jgi:hypothetical protein
MDRTHTNRPAPQLAGEPHDPLQPSRITPAEDALAACQHAILLSLNAVLQTDPETTGWWEQVATRIENLENHLAALMASGAETKNQVAELDHLLDSIRQVRAGLQH